MSLTIAVVSSVFFAAVIVGASLLIPIFKGFWWIPVAVAAIFTLVYGLVFHTWWFLLIAVALAALTTACFFVTGWWRVALAVVIVLVTIGAIFITLPGVSKEFDKIKFPSVSQVVPDISKAIDSAKSGIPAANTKPSVDPSCSEAQIIESQTHGDRVIDDLNDGDPFDYSLTIVNPDFPQGNKTLVVLTEPMGNFDIVHPIMYFTSYRLRGTLDQAVCSANKMAGNAQTYVFVGKASTPAGWITVNEANGWWGELVAKQDVEAAINTGGAEWPSHQIAIDTKDRLLKFDTAVHGQVWNPATKGVFHFQVAKGYQMVVPAGLQGTYWEIPDSAVNVQERIIQGSYVVIVRDSINPGNLKLISCGDTLPTTKYEKEGFAAVNWTAAGASWKCEKQ